ncbi:hypothetical protein [Georgenia yuyongxinii]
MSSRPAPVRPRRAWAGRARRVVLLAAAAALAACTPADTPGPVATGAGAEATAPPLAVKPAVRWEYRTPAGYAPSAEPPGPGTAELGNADTACLLQLTRATLPDSAADDRTATEEALDLSMRLLDGAQETGRRDAVLTTTTGRMAAREVTARAAVGAQVADLRMVLRSSAADRALVGLVHICPAGSVDEAVWAEFVAGATLQGATATTF